MDRHDRDRSGLSEKRYRPLSGQGMLNDMKKVGVNTVYALVNWRDWTLLQCFDTMGFKRGDMINLEFKIED